MVVIQMVELEKVLSFLKEYKEFCQKYGLYVGACGCCNSPWIVEGNREEIVDHLEHLIFNLDHELEIDFTIKCDKCGKTFNFKDIACFISTWSCDVYGTCPYCGAQFSVEIKEIAELLEKRRD